MPLPAISPAASFSAAASARGPASPDGTRLPPAVAQKGLAAGPAATDDTGASARATGDTATPPASDAAAKTTGPGGSTANADANPDKQPAKGTTITLSPEAQAQVAKLKARDLEVRQHEAAHMAVAGGLVTSGPSYTYQKGPDGVNYAIGGEVGIDTSAGRTPQETIERAQRIQAAALAPAEPSGPDLAVAAQAQQLETQARSELALQRATQLKQTYAVGKNPNSGSLSVFA